MNQVGKWILSGNIPDEATASVVEMEEVGAVDMSKFSDSYGLFHYSGKQFVVMLEGDSCLIHPSKMIGSNLDYGSEVMKLSFIDLGGGALGIINKNCWMEMEFSYVALERAPKVSNYNNNE